MEQKLIISNSVEAINEHLENGWRVVSITPQYVSTGSSQIISGKFAILLERGDNPATYTEEEVTKLLETQRGNCYVAIYNRTTNEDLARVASTAPEPGHWRK